MNIHEALAFGEAMLQDYGISDPRWNAERILLIALNSTRAHLFGNLKADLTPAEENSYRSMLSRRALHYPLAYLEGVQEFFGRDFRVNESVLIPRPETEEIIRAVLSLSLPASPRILDAGAGSGAIAVTLAAELQNSKVIALELSPTAISVLVENARGKILPVRGNLHHFPFHDNSFDVVVSNPPYVNSDEFDSLPPETRWEPREALIASGDVYAALIESTGRILKQNGYLVFEIGFGQSTRIQNLCEQSNQFKILEIRNDHQNIPRTFVLQKR